MNVLKLVYIPLLMVVSLYALPNEIMFFTADDGKHGNEIWTYDKTSEINMVGDANTYTENTSISNFQKVGDDTYMTININDGNGSQLWKYNQTTKTLTQVTNASNVTDSLNPSYLMNFEDNLYFRGNDDVNGSEIRKLESSNELSIIQTNFFTEDSSPSNFIDYNGKVVFTVYTPENGTELYETDGTNISLIKDIYEGSGSSSPSNFIKYNGKLYFTATDPNYGTELRVYDGTTVSLVEDVDLGTTSSSPTNLTIYDNKLFFRASYLNGNELYSFDGTSVKLVADVGLKEYSGSPNYLTLFDGKLYFTANTHDKGNELFYFDATDNNYTLVSDIYPDTGSSYPSSLTVAGDKLFFSARADDNDQELYYTTGGSSVTKVDVYQGTYTSYNNTYPNQSSPSYLTEFNGNLYFQANGSTGKELYRFNNSTNQAELVSDIFTGTYTSGSNTYQNNGNPNSFIEYNNKLYFIAYVSSSTTRIFEYDGTNTPTALSTAYSNPSNLYVANNKLYFFDNGDGSVYDKDKQLHTYDGTNFTNIVDFNSFSSI